MKSAKNEAELRALYAERRAKIRVPLAKALANAATELTDLEDWVEEQPVQTRWERWTFPVLGLVERLHADVKSWRERISALSAKRR